MGLLGDWRAARERRRKAERYLRELLSPPDAADVDWLATLAGDRTLAERELVFARRALALVVAERDALDDRTASDVAHALSGLMAGEARHARSAAGKWTTRWLAYSAAMAARGQVEAPAARFGRVLLDGAGVAHPAPDDLVRATQFVQATRTRANEALRAVFGVASLPDDIRPSAIRP